MKKKFIFLKILTILLIVCAAECLIFSVFYQNESAEIKNIADVNTSDLDDYTTISFDRLEVLERYAFRTVYEYRDSEGSYSDITYYVYDDSQPMDNNELDFQYYIVKFRDKSGKEYITSMSVSASKDVSSSLTDYPQTISACAGATIITDNKLLNSYDEKLIELRESALDEYSQKSGISRASITLGYQNESIEQARSALERDVTVVRICAIVFAVALIAAAVLLMRYIKKKTKAQ